MKPIHGFVVTMWALKPSISRARGGIGQSGILLWPEQVRGSLTAALLEAISLGSSCAISLS